MFPDEQQPPLSNVIDDFDRAVSHGHTREAGELAYAIAVRLQAMGRVTHAAEYGKKCLSLFEQLPSETLEHVTSQRLEVAGVPIPELMHDGVVRARLGHLL